MSKRGFGSLGKCALAALLVLCMSFMMIPAVAFADDDQDMGDDRAVYAVDVKSTGQPQSQTVYGDVNTSDGGVRAKATSGGSATAEVTGCVNAGDANFGVYVSGRNDGSQATATVGDVSAGAGVHVDASGGTATLNAGNVKSTAEDAENLDCNSFIASKGGAITAILGNVESAFKGLSLSVGFGGGTISVEADTVEAGGTGIDASDGEGRVTATVSDVFSDGTALWVVNEGGKVDVTVNGDALSFAEYGLVYVNNMGGDARVVVSGTLSGTKGGVVLAPDAGSLDLTTWKIESEEGSIISGQDVDAFAKIVNYIVLVEQLVEGGTITAFKADGTELDEYQGYSVTHEGDKIILKVDLQAGYTLEGVYNGKGDPVPLSKDENGDYYIEVPRGGGIYLSAIVNSGREELTVMPPVEALVPIDAVEADDVAAGASERWPLLTYDGVEINEVKLEMKGQIPNLHVTLSNTNDRDIDFDCAKFKIVNVDDDSEIAFNTEVKKLQANEASVECTFTAGANALSAGDRAYVYYDGQLLGAFTVA